MLNILTPSESAAAALGNATVGFKRSLETQPSDPFDIVRAPGLLSTLALAEPIDIACFPVVLGLGRGPGACVLSGLDEATLFHRSHDMQASSPDTRDQLAGLSAPVRDCILKAARLCESSRTGGSRPQPDVPLDGMLQLVMSLDAPSALSCLTQMYAPASSQPSPLDRLDQQASLQGLPNGVSTGIRNGAGLPDLGGTSTAVPPQAGGLRGGLPGSSQFMPCSNGTRDLSAATSNGARSSISQMSSQLRALFEEREPTHHCSAPPSFRQAITPEEQLASLLGASSSHPPIPSSQHNAPLHSLSSPLPASGSDLNSSLLGQLQSQDAFGALLSGVGGDSHNHVPNILTSGAQRSLEGGRDMWPHVALSGHLLDEHAPRPASL
jgi:hypothetical protein